MIQIFLQIFNGMLYLEWKRISHRDLKPLNILVFNEGKTFKIADFGFAK